MAKYKFDCGCEVEMLDEQEKNYDRLPSLKIDFDEMMIDLNYKPGCPLVWDLFASGRTKGVWQLETHLGQSWSEKARPSSLEEISALVSILRPGVLKAELDGKSLAKHYVDRKNGEDEVSYINDELREYLQFTYGVLLYQEQILNIVKGLAKFSEQEADVLRRGLSKKKADEVEKSKKEIIKGFAKVGVLSKEEGQQVADWIEKGNRYLFNHSHGIAYGSLSYITAWLKVHFPLHFFQSWIKFARGKSKSQQEVRELVKDARSFEVDVHTPTINSLFVRDADVCIDVDNIVFGVRSVKSMGGAKVEKLLEKIKQAEENTSCSVQDMSWPEFLLNLGISINKTSIINLISVGMFDFFGISRQRMLYEYDLCRGITKLEVKKLQDLLEKDSNLADLLENFSKRPTKTGPSTYNRAEKINGIVEGLRNPPYSLEPDDKAWIMTQEKELLGTALSFSAVDAVDAPKISNCTCEEFYNSNKSQDLIISAQVVRVNTHKTKKGTDMAFLTLEDNTGELNMIAFPETWEEYKHLLYEEGLVTCIGARSSKNKHDFILEKAYEI